MWVALVARYPQSGEPVRPLVANNQRTGSLVLQSEALDRLKKLEAPQKAQQAGGRPEDFGRLFLALSWSSPLSMPLLSLYVPACDFLDLLPGCSIRKIAMDVAV